MFLYFTQDVNSMHGLCECTVCSVNLNKDNAGLKCRVYRIKKWYIPFKFQYNLLLANCSRLALQIWCDFDRASSLICGNKLPTRCNRGFYYRSYCLLNMFRAPICLSSGAQEYYTVVAVFGISCCGFQVAGLVWSWGLCFRLAGCW